MKEQDSVASAGSDNFSVISWKNFIDYASAEKSDNMQNRGKSEVSRKYSWDNFLLTLELWLASTV